MFYIRRFYFVNRTQLANLEKGFANLTSILANWIVRRSDGTCYWDMQQDGAMQHSRGDRLAKFPQQKNRWLLELEGGHT